MVNTWKTYLSSKSNYYIMKIIHAIITLLTLGMLHAADLLPEASLDYLKSELSKWSSAQIFEIHALDQITVVECLKGNKHSISIDDAKAEAEELFDLQARNVIKPFKVLRILVFHKKIESSIEGNLRHAVFSYGSIVLHEARGKEVELKVPDKEGVPRSTLVSLELVRQLIKEDKLDEPSPVSPGK